MKQYGLLCLFLCFIFGSYTQETTTVVPEWNGDPKVCTINPSTTPGPTRSFPVFPNQAEFGLEVVASAHEGDVTTPSQLTLFQHLYDYNANKLIMIKNQNGFIDKMTYIRRQYCEVTNITQNIDMDGTSATQLSNGTWHIRPLHEYLLFSSNNPSRPIITPTFVGQDWIRGIPVDIWDTCIVDKTMYKTMRRRWAFVQQGFAMPSGIVGNLAVPLQANISTSFSYPNGTEIVEADQIFNVFSYRPGIIESSDQLNPPKGVFCATGSDSGLISLRDAGIEWPSSFSVRVEASSSRSKDWQKFHLRYDRGDGRGQRRIRYDYLPAGAEDYHSVIHDYAENLTYTIDRRVGSCTIKRGVAIGDVNPISNPIEFFIKNEQRFLYSRGEKIWASNGSPRCRGDSIHCIALVTSVDRFPVMVDPDTGAPSGETWDATNVEYGWSVRAPFARPEQGATKTADYPVYLYLRMYRHGSGAPTGFNIRSEDIEYEFYEMSHESSPYDFDHSICYRSNNYEYLHLAFTLSLNKGDAIDGNHIDRAILRELIHGSIVDNAQVKPARVTDIEVDHEQKSNDVSVFFTLLGKTPQPESPTGLAENEITAEQARKNLGQIIDGGNFKFVMLLTDASNAEVEFKANGGSLKGSKLFMSSHTAGKQDIKQKYSSGAEAGAVIGGLLVGLLVGIIIAAVIRIVRKEPMPDIPGVSKSFSNPLPNISFYNKKSTNEAPVTTAATSDA